MLWIGKDLDEAPTILRVELGTLRKSQKGKPRKQNFPMQFTDWVSWLDMSGGADQLDKLKQREERI